MKILNSMMSVGSSEWSKTSVSSGKSRRSGKSLAEKIRELGINLRNERTPSTWKTLRYIDIKTEDNMSSKISVMTPNLNLEQIVYYQPEVILNSGFSGKSIYKIEKFETKSTGPKEIMRISDIEVKSFKPSKQIKFRKKKRRSSIIMKIEDILNKGKSILPVKDPSEESVVIHKELQELPQRVINDLPEEVLQKIFFYLSQQERCSILSRVCKSWYYILKDPIFWTEFEFKGDRVPTDVIIQLIKKFPSMEKLYLTSVPDAVEILQELCRCNNVIKNLGVRYCNISNQDFVRLILHVISCCTNLEVLNIKGMQFQSERFYLELGRLKNLRSLNLTGNRFLTNQDLMTASINCRNLQELKILDTAFNTITPTLKDEDLIFITSHLENNLRTLKIDMQQLGNVSYQTKNLKGINKGRGSKNNCKFSFLPVSCSKKKAILKCLNLKCLALKNCLLLTGNMFRQFSVLTKLKKLKITSANNIKPEDFQYVFDNENVKHIEDLDISGCWRVGTIGLQAITNTLGKLKSLSLKSCKSIKGNDLSLLSHCPKLTYLNLAHVEIEAHHLQCLHKHVKNLRHIVIDLNLCKKSTVRQLRKSFPSLNITISYCEFRKDERPLNDF